MKRAIVVFALALAACSGGDDSDGTVDVDGCLEEATTEEETDTCLIGEELDDLEGLDEFMDCVSEPDNTVAECEELLG